MKKKRVPYGLLSVAVGWLMCDVYYWAMRRSAGVLRRIDILVCMVSGLICVGILIFGLVQIVRKKKES